MLPVKHLIAVAFIHKQTGIGEDGDAASHHRNALIGRRTNVLREAVSCAETGGGRLNELN